MAKGIYRAYQYFGRGCEISGVFVADSEGVARANGHSTWYSEFAGKHSEAQFEINSETVKLLTDDAVAVEIVEKYGLSCGENPVERWLEDAEEDESE